ncbi:hypothetical protein PUNSTDRAFT_134040 [Punctularia strigosozonata HHB-11173 SS5]|uniref:uncharacterized protein n=1 Tax=Punctularia strigosozonata (strain HHB-11173) TaxID=741275 RepID=UPI0004416E7D|nr:uncharacterized protein PUNSTDRAFT_134040 [Punctularia strigosozonata HHB-11173 SS5]EIN08865.1 hypothetical protein PUNSTDRAFT_134040 [Punctularia strigosozonata HHB-11173 SS5]
MASPPNWPSVPPSSSYPRTPTSASSSSSSTSQFSRSSSNQATADYHAAKREAAEKERERKEWNKAHGYRPDPEEHVKRHREIAKLRLTEATLRWNAGQDHYGGFDPSHKTSADHYNRITDAHLGAQKHLKAAAEIQRKYGSAGSSEHIPSGLVASAPSNAYNNTYGYTNDASGAFNSRIDSSVAGYAPSHSAASNPYLDPRINTSYSVHARPAGSSTHDAQYWQSGSAPTGASPYLTAYGTMPAPCPSHQYPPGYPAVAQGGSNPGRDPYAMPDMSRLSMSSPRSQQPYGSSGTYYYGDSPRSDPYASSSSGRKRQ